MRPLILLIFICFSVQVVTQCDMELPKFGHHTVVWDTDTVHYHTYAKNPKAAQNIFLYLQGSGAVPLFQVKRDSVGLHMSSSIPMALFDLPDEYLLVVISKKGMPFCTTLGEPLDIPAAYYETEGLDYRTGQANAVLGHLLALLEKQPQKILALGHSEGSDVVAKLGTENRHITHFGYLSGSGHSQWYDFALFIRQQVNRGELSEEDAALQMDSLFDRYRDIAANKGSIEKQWYGNSYKRWYGFSEPPIDNLLQIDKPVFVAMGTADKSVPIESVYMIPVEFIRQGKDNLTFKTYPGLDHNFNVTGPAGPSKRHWNEVIRDFLKWAGE